MADNPSFYKENCQWMAMSRSILPFLSHYAQKYIMEKYANKPILDDGGYEDQLFKVLDELCDALGEIRLDRSELIDAAKFPNLMWSA